jgi:hypothetical protein
MEKNFFTRNPYGIRIKMCCASCEHKAISRLQTVRFCKEHTRKVQSSDLCLKWKMASQLKNVGSSQGDVRDKDTKEVLF